MASASRRLPRVTCPRHSFLPKEKMILEKLRLLIVAAQKTVNFLDFFWVYLNFKKAIIKTSNNLKAALRPNSIDYWLYIENLVDDVYELKSLRHLKFNYIVDIGANIGLFTVATKAYWPKAKRYLFEPNPNSFKLLKVNLKLNKIKATAKQVAVIGVSSSKKVKLYENSNPAMASVAIGSGKYYKVKTESLQSIVPSLGKTLLKIDIEGGEYSLLNNQNKTVFKRVCALLMETHDLNKNKNTAKVLKYLVDCGFKVYHNNRNVLAINNTPSS